MRFFQFFPTGGTIHYGNLWHFLSKNLAVNTARNFYRYANAWVLASNEVSISIKCGGRQLSGQDFGLLPGGPF